MISINIDKSYSDFIAEYANKFNLGGFSNLKSADLNKASREDFQYGGIAAEIGWYLHRYGSIEKLKDIMSYKFEVLKPQRLGDGGFDDKLNYENQDRFLDVKSSHVTDESKIQYLNLIIAPREYHKNMIYVAAFTVGVDRRNITKVILAGWAPTEDIKEKWRYDPIKYCVPVKKLRDMELLNKFIK